MTPSIKFEAPFALPSDLIGNSRLMSIVGPIEVCFSCPIRLRVLFARVSYMSLLSIYVCSGAVTNGSYFENRAQRVPRVSQAHGEIQKEQSSELSQAHD
jgi:hypothetical protein